MTLEERERMQRAVSASSRFTAEPAGLSASTTFANVEQQALIDRLLSSDSATDFFRQPPFSLSAHAAPKMLDAAFKRAGRLVHPDKCTHPRATEAFQRLAHFRAAEVAKHDVEPLRRDKCEECGAVPEKAAMLFTCVGCGRKACHACNFGLIDKSGPGVSGDRHCYTCVWLQEDLKL